MRNFAPSSSGCSPLQWRIGFDEKLDSTKFDTEKIGFDESTIRQKIGFNKLAIRQKIGFDESMIRQKIGFDESTIWRKIGFDESTIRRKIGFDKSTIRRKIGFDENRHRLKFTTARLCATFLKNQKLFIKCTIETDYHKNINFALLVWRNGQNSYL
jgi:hypothetical protein